MKKWDKKDLRIGMIILILMMVMVVISIRYHQIWAQENSKENSEEVQTYQHHCAFICEDREDPVWVSIYKGARDRGASYGIYVEQYGEKLLWEYSVDDFLEMAIASGVDSIILQGNSRESTTRLINKANEAGILVITVYEDNMDSKRKSFIGNNFFQTGYTLGKEAVSSLEGEGEKEDQLMVLLQDDEEKSDNNTITSGMQKYLDEVSSNLKISPQIMSSDETYEVEEEIRSLLKNKKQRPKVLVCTTVVQTQCAYQTVVDLNCVGDVKIIGNYATESILDAISRDVIYSTYMVDSKQMGEKAVEAIEEYREYNYVSDYISVDASVIRKEQARELLTEAEEQSDD